MTAILASYLAAAVLTVATIKYALLIGRGKKMSPPAGWLIATVATTIGYVAYWFTDDPLHPPTLGGNVAHLFATIEIWIVFGTLVWSLHRRGQLAVEFDWFQKSCLALSLGVLIFWWSSGRADLVFYLFQSLMVISYVAMLGKVLTWNENKDYTPMWIAIFFVGVLGLVPAWIKDDMFGMVNCVRIILSTGILIGVLVRLDRRSRVLQA